MTSSSVSTGQTPAPPRVQPSGVEIEGIALRDLRYFEDAGVDSEEIFDDAWPEPGQLNFTGLINLISHTNVEFSMFVRARLTVDDAVFGLMASFSAMFSRSKIIEARPFLQFINRQGAPLLFPYVREVVSSVSARSVYRPVNLAPLIIAPLIDEETLDAHISNLETLIAEQRPSDNINEPKPTE